jgi:hypothetical protein
MPEPTAIQSTSSQKRKARNTEDETLQQKNRKTKSDVDQERNISDVLPDETQVLTVAGEIINAAETDIHIADIILSDKTKVRFVKE